MIALARNAVGEARRFVDRLRKALCSDAPALLEAITTRADGEVLLAHDLARLMDAPAWVGLQALLLGGLRVEHIRGVK